MKLVFRPAEVAAILNISLSSLYGAIGRGELPARKIGRNWLVTRASLEQFLGMPIPEPVSGSGAPTLRQGPNVH